MTRRTWAADGLLLLTTLIWGVAFAVVKDTLQRIPPGLIVCIRHFISACITAVLFRRHLKGLRASDVRRGALVGFLLVMAYLVQTEGLALTTAGKNAFLTTTYVLFVPIALRLFFGRRLGRRVMPAALLMLCGIALLSLGGEQGGLNRGDALTLVCGVFFAAHIIAVERCQKETNVYALIVLQFAFCSLTALMWTLAFERNLPVRPDRGAVLGIGYLAVFSTTIGMSLQNLGQSMAPGEHAALILSTESVFGALAGVLFLGERVTPVMGAGFAVIFLALVLCETEKSGTGQNP
ncbi:MAG: DMT family transporter [Clostridia bacterium]|nr:DMT family transporter [Clostridia bacterium]